MAQGKLIVIEGGDGSGKGTQKDLLLAELTRRNIPYETMDFPRYGKSFFGDLAGQMLAGDLGGLESLPAELSVLPFACDRWLLKDELSGWLRDGKIVISNRYTGSSAVYHAAKMPKEKQFSFIDWVYKLEQEVIGLPREDIALYLHVPVAVAQKLIETKSAREYLGEKKKDIYEESITMQQTVEGLYLSMATNKSNWKTIECVEGDAIKTTDAIHKDIVDVLTVNGVL